MADNAVESELNVEFSEALLPTIQLLNASTFSLPLMLADSAIESVGMHDNHLQSLLRKYDCDLEIQTLTVGNNPLVQLTTDLGHIADSFLAFLSEIWDLDASQALMVLGNIYNPDFSLDQTPWWEDAINIAGIVVAAVGIVALAIPTQGASFGLGLVVAGTVLNSLGIFINYSQDEITGWNATYQIAAIAALVITGLAAEGMIASRLTSLAQNAQFRDFLEGLTFAGADALVGAASEHGSDPESILSALEFLQVEAGLTEQQAREFLANIGHGMQDGEANPFAVDSELINQYGGFSPNIPESGDDYGPVFSSDGGATPDISSHGVSIEDYQIQTGTTSSGDPVYTTIGRYNYEQVREVYPDFVSWLDARYQDYSQYSGNRSFSSWLDATYFSGNSNANGFYAPDHYGYLIRGLRGDFGSDYP